MKVVVEMANFIYVLQQSVAFTELSFAKPTLVQRHDVVWCIRCDQIYQMSPKSVKKLGNY